MPRTFLLSFILNSLYQIKRRYRAHTRATSLVLVTVLTVTTSSCENGIRNWSAPSVVGASLNHEEREQPQIKNIIENAQTLNLAAISREINTITEGPVDQTVDCVSIVPLPQIKPSEPNSVPLPQEKPVAPQLRRPSSLSNDSPFSQLHSDASRSSISLWATHYYTPVYSAASNGVALKKKNESSILYNGEAVVLDQRRWCLAAMEGSVTIRMKDGKNKTYNYSGVGSMQTDCTQYFKGKHRATGRVKFSEVRSAWGLGVRNYSLIPYRTIAVDPSVIPYGSVVFIQDAVGKEISLADGTTFTHDGYFFAGDTGGAIKENHIDVFTGNNSSSNFSFIRSRETGTFSAQLVDDPELKEKLIAFHRREY